MRKFIKNTISLLVCLLVISCDNYLDVKPEDKYLKEHVFSSKYGIQMVMNGIYTNMAADASYGENLTLSTVDVLGQCYNVGSDRHQWHEIGNYDYSDNNVKVKFDVIWKKMYNNILDINSFVETLRVTENIISNDEKKLLEGEAIGLRAMLHFDLLRLFGPIYSTNADDIAIPYQNKAKSDFTSLLSAKDVMGKILDDLAVAERLLKDDPIRESGVSVNNKDDFYKFRNLRLNYYAVKALQARVNLYAGNRQEALLAAKAVIEEATEWFPWTNYLDVIAAGPNPDRIFSKEILFGLDNRNLYNNHNRLFNSSLKVYDILMPKESRLESDIFENNFNDYRLKSSWIVAENAEIPQRTLFKFADISDKTLRFRFMQPLIRMSEMYYIVAEIEGEEGDMQVALNHLNEVRLNRGLLEVNDGANLQDEILKEYQREFFGEGQLFFYYKRRNFTEIPDASTSGFINVGSVQYVVPLPLSEMDFRQ